MVSGLQILMIHKGMITNFSQAQDRWFTPDEESSKEPTFYSTFFNQGVAGAPSGSTLIDHPILIFPQNEHT